MSKLNAFINDIKSDLSMKDFVSGLGYEVGHDDKIPCPFHTEKTPSCVIYQQHFKCFGGGCGKYGDFIDFYLGLNPGASFMDAVNAGAEVLGKNPLESSGYNAESLTETIYKIKERKKVEEIYQHACKYYESELEKTPDTISWAIDTWGFSEEFLKSKRVGYAPSNPGHLKRHLLEKGYNDQEIASTGLFYKGKNGLFEVFLDRVIFPYLMGETPKYFIGRIPRPTEEDEILYRDDVRPKYKKLLVHNEDKRPYVSSTVENSYLYGEEALRDRSKEEIIITEGITDAMLAEMYGFNVISPVTTRLRKQDLERFLPLFKRKRKVYISNDNEDNRSGEKGALSVANFLEAEGVYVNIAILPRKEGMNKVDLNDFLRTSNDPKAAFELILKNSRPPLFLLLQSIPKALDEIERTHQILSFSKYWARVMPANLPTYIKYIKEHFGLNTDQSKALLSQIKQLQKDIKKNNEPDNISVQDKSNWSLKDVIDDYLENPPQGRMANVIADQIYNYLEKNGAQFYSNTVDYESIIFYKNKLYPFSSPAFRSLMFELGELSKESSLGRQVFDCLNQRIILNGHKIDMFSWIYTTKDGAKYLNLSGDPESKVVVMDKRDSTGVKAVRNGNNRDSVILASPINTAKFTYNENVDVKKAMKILDKLIFSNLSCHTADKYMIMSWVISSLFVDKLGTRPHMRFEGNAGSGKTTAAKMITTLMFGKPTHQNASTMAAIYETSRSSPIVCLDNIENKDLDDRTMNFIIASATRATRQKKGGASYGDVIEQSPQCMVLTTGIEPLHKNELIQRSLVVNFDKEWQVESFLEPRVLDEIRYFRDDILSALIKIAELIYRTVRNYERITKIGRYITRNYPDNPKGRNIDALCHMFIACRYIAKYIKHDYTYEFEQDYDIGETIPVSHTGSINPHREIFQSWVAIQSTSDEDINTNTNPIVYFLDRICEKAINGGFSSEYIESEFGIKTIREEGFFYILATTSNLHGAFAKLSREGVRYEYESPLQLSKRIRDSSYVLLRAGWIIGKNAKRTSQERVHVLAKSINKGSINVLKNTFPKAKWYLLPKNGRKYN